MEFLLDGIRAVTPQQCVMYVVGALLIYLAIKKDYEPSLLLPMGFGAILVNLPMSGVLNQMVAGVGESQGIIQWLFETTSLMANGWMIGTSAIYEYAATAMGPI